jgi:hypothetical protein
VQLHFGMALTNDHGRKRHGGNGSSLHFASCGRIAAEASRLVLFSRRSGATARLVAFLAD